MNPTLSKKKESQSIKHIMEVLGPTLLKSIRDPFGIFSNYRILWINKALAIIHKGEQKDAIGKICYKVFYGRKNPCSDCPLIDVIKTGRTQVIERYMDFPDGIRRWGEVRSYPVRGQDKSLVAIIVIIIEVTDKKLAIRRQKEYSEYLSKKLKETSGKSKEIKNSKDEITIKVNLSRRETDVLRLITEGYTNIQISELLFVSANTIKSHVNHIFNKLGVNDRTQAAVLAVRHKLI
jgi:DNA-binding CsgD family transcriptional regulator